MKKLTLILVLITVASFLIFSLVCSQPEQTPGSADSTNKGTIKTDTTSKVTTKTETTKTETTTGVVDTTKKEATKTVTTKTETTKAETTTTVSTKVVNKYIGTAKCKMCHNSEVKGKIYDQWSAEGHAKAYQTLLNEQSKGIAKGMGIADASKSEKCLKCHVTGYNEATGDKYSMEEGVTCEACHGPGENYWKMQIMKDKKQAMVNGLVEPTEVVCVKCHNKESPTYKAFKYADAIKLVQHKVGPVAPKIEKK